MPDQPTGSEPTPLEPIQYQDLYREEDVPLEDVRDNTLRFLVYFGTGITVLFILMGSIARIPRQFTFDFVLKGEQQELVYRFFDAVYLEERFVDAGAPVTADAPLVTVSAPQIVELIDAYESASEKQRIFDETERFVYQNQIDALGLEEAKLEAAARDFEEQKTLGWRVHEQEREQLQFRATQASETIERERALFQKKMISQERFNQAREAQVNAKTALAALTENRRKTVAELDAQIRMAALEREITIRRRQETEKQLENLTASLASEVDRAYRTIERNYGNFEIENGSLRLKAPVAGTVSYLSDTERDVPAGGILLKILRNPSALYAHASIPPQQIGMVRVEAPAILKVATFPHYTWGTLQGRVRHLSLTPDDQGAYPFEVELTDHGNLQPLLQIGMTGQLSILVDEKSFFAYVFEKVQQGYYAVVE